MLSNDFIVSHFAASTWIIPALLTPILVFTVLLLLESRFDVIDQAWLSRLAYERLGQQYYEQLALTFGPGYRAFNRSAEDEVKNLCEKLNLTIKYHGLENIPKGPFIMISNEHTNFDGSFLVQAVNKVRGDKETKLLRIIQYPGDTDDQYSLPLVKFGKVNNTLVPNAEKIIYEHLSNGRPMVMFPSGKFDDRLFDKDGYFRFRSGYLRFAMAAQVDLVPAYIHIKFPFWLRFINSIWPKFAEDLIFLLTLEILRNQTIVVVIGKSISFQELKKDYELNGKYKPEAYADRVFGLRQLVSNGAELYKKSSLIYTSSS